MSSSTLLTLHVKCPTVDHSPFTCQLPATATVRELKAALADHFPTHPPIQDQRIVHAGRLLDNDGMSLFDALRLNGNGGDTNMTVHLVVRSSTGSSAAVGGSLTAAPPSYQSITGSSAQPSVGPTAVGSSSPSGNVAGTPPLDNAATTSSAPQASSTATETRTTATLTEPPPQQSTAIQHLQMFPLGTTSSILIIK
jgi:hypothetical protein